MDDNIIEFGKNIPKEVSVKGVEDVLSSIRNEGEFDKLFVVGISKEGYLKLFTNFETMSEVNLLLDVVKFKLVSMGGAIDV